MFESAEETMDNILKRIGESQIGRLKELSWTIPVDLVQIVSMFCGETGCGTDSNGSVSEGGDQ